MFEEYTKSFLDSFITIPLDKIIKNRVQEVMKLRKFKNTKELKQEARKLAIAIFTFSYQCK
jgi:hypothetical protein